MEASTAAVEAEMLLSGAGGPTAEGVGLGFEAAVRCATRLAALDAD